MKLKAKSSQCIMVKSTRYVKKIIACAMVAVILFTCSTMAFAADGEQLALTPEQLKGMTQEQLAELSQEKSDATLNEMMQLFLNGNKTELNKYLDALGLATTYDEYAEQKQESYQETSNPGIQPLWASDYDGEKVDMNCHAGITQIGSLIYLGAINILFNGGTFGYTLNDLAILVKESEYPDKDLSSKMTGFSGHFYDPDTGKNFLLDSSNTAVTNARFHYDSAIKKYQSGDRTGAMTELAYSLHFLQDAGEPHHASNLTALLPENSPESGRWNHAKFEERASKLLYQMEIDLDDIDYSLDYYKNFEIFYINHYVHEAAVTAKSYKNMAISEEITQQNLAAVLLMYKSMMDTSGMLYRFAKDTGMI